MNMQVKPQANGVSMPTDRRDRGMNEQSKDEVRAAVREQYGAVATATSAGSCTPGCCGPGPDASLALGYDSADLAAVPEGANMGLGCGNPQALAALAVGETVLELGSGGGFDCFLAAKQVGPSGTVIGVDITSDMVAKARSNARKLGTTRTASVLGFTNSPAARSWTITGRRRGTPSGPP